MKRVLVTVVLMAVAFLAAYVPMQWKNYDLQQQDAKSRQELSAQLAAAEDSLRMAKLQNQLGLLLIDVEQTNFGEAKQSSTQFFDQLREALSSVQSEAARARLEAALKRRDQITADLSVMKPGLAETLQQFYLEFSGESSAKPAAQP